LKLKKVVLTVGPCLAGKTDAAQVLAKIGYEHFSTKKLVDEDPECKRIIAAGGNIPDSVMVPLLDLHLPKGGMVNVDSPRSQNQARWLTVVKYPCNKFQVITIFLAVDPANIWKRLAHRRETQPGRPDDDPATVAIRLGKYEAFAPGMLDFLRRTTDFRRIDANKSPAEVAKQVRMAVGSIPQRIYIYGASFKRVPVQAS
jgi:adenylate kinase family enzyme